MRGNLSNRIMFNGKFRIKGGGRGKKEVGSRKSVSAGEFFRKFLLLVSPEGGKIGHFLEPEKVVQRPHLGNEEGEENLLPWAIK